MKSASRQYLGTRVLLAVAATIVCGTAQAQAWPSKALRIIVPTAAGGGNDVIARTIGEKMAESLKQPVIVENKVGASSIIAGDFVAKSPADGYTILFNGPLIVQSAALLSKLPYDPLTDFIPVTDVIRTPLWVAVSTAKTQARTLKEYVDQAKTRPNDFPYASIGAGSSHHLYGYRLNQLIGGQHIPYKGGAPAIIGVAGGEVASVFLDWVSVKPHVDSGKVRVLAVTGTKRTALTPDVPTLSELGFQGFESYGWGALFVPAKTPMDIVGRIEAEVVKSLKHPDVMTKFAGFGFELGGTPQAQFVQQFRGDYDRWTTLIKSVGVRLD